MLELEDSNKELQEKHIDSSDGYKSIKEDDLYTELEEFFDDLVLCSNMRQGKILKEYYFEDARCPYQTFSDKENNYLYGDYIIVNASRSINSVKAKLRSVCKTHKIQFVYKYIEINN
jgi:hypothetical protein